jgi:hypothetical protein
MQATFTSQDRPMNFTPARHRIGRHAWGCAMLVFAAACASADRSTGGDGNLRTLIGDAACDSDAQCHTIGVGAKACGGPQAHVAWSSVRTDPGPLRALVERQAAAERDEAAAKGMLSTCSVVPDPGARCDLGAPVGGRAGTCRLRPAPAGGGAAIR